jgi:hypothetical protein
LDDFALSKKSYVAAQLLASRRKFERSHSPNVHEATVNQAALEDFDACWKDADGRLKIVPGKEALSYVNHCLQTQYGVSITPTAIIDAMAMAEIPAEVQTLLKEVDAFASTKVG